jgi:hypothetical protein
MLREATPFERTEIAGDFVPESRCAESADEPPTAARPVIAPQREFPEGRRFAFTIIDDTDVATVENVQPIYRLLEQLGMRATKTVWGTSCPEGSKNFSSSQTLEDPAYRDFVIDLRNRGFEIAWHGATMESSVRERTIEGLERFREALGTYPRTYANHALNQENLYWGPDRVDNRILKTLYVKLLAQDPEYFEGQNEGSAFWWGDLCASHIDYVRNLTFDEINLLRVNPSLPYHDPSRPLVRWWFSAADAEGRAEFNELLKPMNQDRLRREGGVCIVATHFGKGFVRDGAVHPRTRTLLESLAGADGWFPPVAELLDWLVAQRRTREIPEREWERMQWRWARDLFRRKVKAARARRAQTRSERRP